MVRFPEQRLFKANRPGKTFKINWSNSQNDKNPVKLKYINRFWSKIGFQPSSGSQIFLEKISGRNFIVSKSVIEPEREKYLKKIKLENKRFNQKQIDSLMMCGQKPFFQVYVHIALGCRSKNGDWKGVYPFIDFHSLKKLLKRN